MLPARNDVSPIKRTTPVLSPLFTISPNDIIPPIHIRTHTATVITKQQQQN
jgi:hypothetical protein